MKIKLALLFAAGTLLVILAGCSTPQLAQTPYNQDEQQWSEFIEFAYPQWKPPQTTPPNSDINEPLPNPVVTENVPLIQPAPVVVADDAAKDKPVTAATTYTVEKGDSLWKIAHKTLGDGKKWPVILDANKEKISDAGKLKAGIVLNIPAQ